MTGEGEAHITSKVESWQIEELLVRLSLDYIERPGEVSRWKEKVAGSLKGNERNHEMWRLLGGICYIEGDFERAAECFTHCVNLDPSNVQYNKNLAFALRQMGRYGEFDDIMFDKLPSLKKRG
jgi:cytochrome c-type biogenesis protein CcmH/NrfG